MPGQDLQTRYQELVRWIADHGGFVHPSLVLAQSDAGGGERTLIGEKKVLRWDNLVCIPKRLCLNPATCSADAAVASPWFASLREGQHLVEHMPDGGARVWALLWEMSRGPDSPFWPYLQSLPTPTESEHVLLTSQEPEVLRRVSLFSPALGALLQSVHRDAERLSQVLQERNTLESAFEPSDISVERVLWAVAMLFSRQWGQDVLIPVIDLFQHNSSAKSFVTREDDEDRVVFYVEDHYEAGDQIFNCYGPHDTLEMMLHYGFFDERYCDPLVRVQYEHTDQTAVEQVVLQSLAETLRVHDRSPALFLSPKGANGDLELFLQMTTFHHLQAREVAINEESRDAEIARQLGGIVHRIDAADAALAPGASALAEPPRNHLEEMVARAAHWREEILKDARERAGQGGVVH